MARDARTAERMREARRRFLASCGKVANPTAPVVTLLLAGPRQTYATAQAGQHHRRSSVEEERTADSSRPAADHPGDTRR